MRILALDTSTLSGSAALLDGQRLVAQELLDPALRTAQSLAPALGRLLADAAWRAREVELVAVGVGPGSFTGLRIAVATAKTFAYAVGAAMLGVDTLAALAWSTGAALAPPAGAHLAAVLDAQRQQLFAASFRWEAGGSPTALAPTQIVSRDAWLETLPAGAIVVGAGLAPLVDHLPAGTIVAPRELWVPQAAAVGRLAENDYRRGVRHDLFALRPNYLRRSAAEEKRTGDEPSIDSVAAR